MRFEEELGHTHLNPKRISILKYICYGFNSQCLEAQNKKRNFSKFPIKIFCFNNKGTTKIKDLQNLSNREIYFTLQSNNTKYIKPFKLISWPNFIEGYQNLSPSIWCKIFTDWFVKCSDGCIFTIWSKFVHFFLPLNHAIYRMGK